MNRLRNTLDWSPKMYRRESEKAAHQARRKTQAWREEGPPSLRWRGRNRRGSEGEREGGRERERERERVKTVPMIELRKRKLYSE